MDETSEPVVGLVLLAAGSSRRMGRPKLLLPYRGRTLLRRAAETAVGTRCDPVIVVLGPMPDEMSAELAGLDLHIADNPVWEAGIGTSICTGIRSLQDLRPDVAAAVVMLADQPLIASESIDALIDGWRSSDADIAASDYGDGIGVPALFDRRLFEDLVVLAPEQGAKQLIAEYNGPVCRVFSGGAGVDVDTRDDYNLLLRTYVDTFDEGLQNKTASLSE